MNDHSLVERLQAGDNTAFAEMMATYGGRLLAVIRRYVSDADRAEDVLQETWIGAFRGIARFQGGSALGTWLHRVAVNFALMHLRGKKRRSMAPLPGKDADWEPPSKDPGPLEAAGSAEAVAALRGLSDVFALRAAGLTLKQTSDALQIGLTTVKDRLSRARGGPSMRGERRPRAAPGHRGGHMHTLAEILRAVASGCSAAALALDGKHARALPAPPAEPPPAPSVAAPAPVPVVPPAAPTPPAPPPRAYGTHHDETRARHEANRIQARKDGRAARLAGKTVDDNPHKMRHGTGGSLRVAWEAGWDEEDAASGDRPPPGAPPVMRASPTEPPRAAHLDAPKIVVPAKPLEKHDHPALADADPLTRAAWSFLTAEGGEWNTHAIAKGIAGKTGPGPADQRDVWIALGNLVDAGLVVKRPDPDKPAAFLYRTTPVLIPERIAQ